MRNLCFFVFLAVLCNVATAKRWHRHPYQSYGHHIDPYAHGYDSSSSEEDWSYYNGYVPYNHYPFSYRNNLHQPFTSWGGHGEVGFHGIRRQTPTSQTPVANIESCQRDCSVTSEYQPVCGTDYQTYNNMGRLVCAQRCGSDVKIFLWRACPSLDVGTVRSTTVQCIASCTLTEENKPICGSDDVTYDNLSKLQCAQKCGYGVTVKAMTACSEITTTTQSSLLARTPPIPYHIRSCIESCSTTPEFKPVCGSNDVTYQNPSHLDCARICGIDVELKQRTACGQTINANTNQNVGGQNVNPLSPTSVQMCLASCPVTADLNPVCGSNGITYPNPSQLECDKSCGMNVDLVQRSPCPNNGNNINNIVTTTSPTTTTTTLSPQNQACIDSCPRTQEYNPICGTDGVTYNNFGHLTCAQTCGIKVEIQRRSQCPRPATTEAPTTDQPLTNQQVGTQAIDTNGNSGSQTSNVNNSVNPLSNNGATTSDALINVFMDKTTSTTEPDEETDFDTRFGDRL